MYKTTFENLLKKTDPKLVEKVDFKLNPVPGEIGQVLSWSDTLNKVLTKDAISKLNLNKEDKYQLNELKLFLQYSIEGHIEARYNCKVKNGKIIFSTTQNQSNT